MLEKYSAKVIEVRELTQDVKEISLKLIDPPEVFFSAGQYITIEITEIKEGRPRLNNRPYSIASSPQEKTIFKLCTNRVGNGPGSTYLHSLKPDDLLQFCLPIGYFRVNEQSDSALLFVATGTGIAPIKSMISHLLQTGSLRPIQLYWGLRKEEGLYYQDELAEWASKYPSFRYVTTLSQPSSQWTGMRGRVTHHLPALIENVENLEAYLCGNGEMIKEVRAILLEKGMPKKAIHFEKFY